MDSVQFFCFGQWEDEIEKFPFTRNTDLGGYLARRLANCKTAGAKGTIGVSVYCFSHPWTQVRLNFQRRVCLKADRWGSWKQQIAVSEPQKDLKTGVPEP